MRTPHPRHRRRHARGRTRDRGIALVFVTFAMAVLLVALAGSLVTGSANSRATSNYRSAAQAHFAAESGVTEAIQRINQTGIINFQNDVVGSWDTRWGSTWHSGPMTGYRYTVTPVANGVDPQNRGRLVAKGTGTASSANTVVAEIQRTNNLSTAPGAVYLATDANVNPTFNGSTFQINGNDHDYNGGAGPGAPVPGLSTRNQTNTTEVVDTLNNTQMSNITGLGFQSDPVVPSVMTSAWAPSITQMNQFVTDLLALPGVVTSSDTTITGNMTLGTISPPVPQITYSTGSVTVKGAGTVVGSGVWIVDGDLEIQGTLNFAGLIIVRGKTITGKDPGALVTGNATVYGSLWSQDVNFTAGGSSVVNYSTNALALANQVAGGQALPTTIKVIALADCATIPSGSNGCP